MGLVLDSSVLIAAERAKRPVSQLLAALSTEYWEAEFLLSSITVMELEWESVPSTCIPDFSPIPIKTSTFPSAETARQAFAATFLQK